MGTHTQGPWMAMSGLSRWNVTTATGPRTHNIAAINTDRTEQEANARIIAAAPELLTALQALTITARTFRNVPKENQDWTAYDDMALDNAFDAIARAQGAAQ